MIDPYAALFAPQAPRQGPGGVQLAGDVIPLPIQPMPAVEGIKKSLIPPTNTPRDINFYNHFMSTIKALRGGGGGPSATVYPFVPKPGGGYNTPGSNDPTKW